MYHQLLVLADSRFTVRVGGRRLSLPTRVRTSNQVSVTFCDVLAYTADLYAVYYSEPVTKQSPRLPESLQITLALQLRGRGLSRTPSMHVMTRRHLRRNAERATVRMKTNDGCVRTRSAKQRRIGSAENRTVHPASMHGYPNQEARLLFKAESEPDGDERGRENQGSRSRCLICTLIIPVTRYMCTSPRENRSDFSVRKPSTVDRRAVCQAESTRSPHERVTGDSVIQSLVVTLLEITMRQLPNSPYEPWSWSVATSAIAYL